jgi:hypothetical protein
MRVGVDIEQVVAFAQNCNPSGQILTRKLGHQMDSGQFLLLRSG